MSDSPSSPYDELVELIERELQLAGEGRFDELALLTESRIALAATLPDQPPASARPALTRAKLLQERLTIEVLRGREAVLLALAEVQHVRRAAQGYAPPPRSPRISTSA